MRSQGRSAAGWILAPALVAAALLLPGGAGAETKTGQSPDCRRFCVSVEPRRGPEDSVFRFRGRGWRPGKRVEVAYGPYCRPDAACPAIAYVGRLRVGPRGYFRFSLRAGSPESGDRERGISSGSRPAFEQWLGEPYRSHLVRRAPRYRVVVPG